LRSVPGPAARRLVADRSSVLSIRLDIKSRPPRRRRAHARPSAAPPFFGLISAGVA